MGKMKLVRRGFRTKPAHKTSTARNTLQPKGRPIVVSDIVKHALPGHPPCKGKGYTKTPSGVATVCKCAAKRFLKEHPEAILDGQGGAWWPAKKPAEVVDELPDEVKNAIRRAPEFDTLGHVQGVRGQPAPDAPGEPEGGGQPDHGDPRQPGVPPGGAGPDET